MPTDDNRQAKLRQYLLRVTAAADGTESLDLLDNYAEGVGSVDPAVGNRAVEKIRTELPLDLDEMGALEAIIHTKDRPAIDVVNDDFSRPSKPWRQLSDPPIKGRIQAVLASVGRIELPEDSAHEYGGTGFVVGKGLVMTNRHVARLFNSGLGRQDLRLIQPAGVDFTREIVPRPEVYVQVKRVVMVHPYWDMALVEVDGLAATQPPVRLRAIEADALAQREVVVVGFPARDWRNPNIDLQNQIFGGKFGIKRLQPGRIMGTSDFRPTGDPEVVALTHDSSTLGGNSGSLVLDLETGAVVGLHFAGSYLVHNYAVPVSELGKDTRIRDAGLEIEGASNEAAVAWDPEWAKADPESIEKVTTLARPTEAVGGGTVDASAGGSLVTVTIPLRIELSLNGGVGGHVNVVATTATGPQGEAPVEAVADAPPGGGKLKVEPDPDYDGRAGYDPDFLGSRIAVPWLSDQSYADVAFNQRNGEKLLHYHHYSLAMSKSRRMAFFTACNIDGAQIHTMKRDWFSGDRWSFDPRLDRKLQIGDELYSSNPLDRGHLVRRLDPVWGGSFAAAKRANDDTFHWTNCSPQHEGFNRHATLWGGIEDYILENADRFDLKVTVFTGPIFAETDQEYREVRIPSAYWKVVVARRLDTGALSATAYILSQEALIDGLEEAFSYGAWKTFQVSVADLERRSGLQFRGLGAHDPLAQGAEEGLEAQVAPRWVRNHAELQL